MSWWNPFKPNKPIEPAPAPDGFGGGGFGEGGHSFLFLSKISIKTMI